MNPLSWLKLGQIFDPTEHQLPNGCREFAQSPQVLVFDDFVRVYFSTRSVDTPGSFVSHIAYVDMDSSFSRVLRVADAPVFTSADLGTFDEHGIFPVNLVRHDGRVLAYTCGWSRRSSVPVETAIGLAESHDEGRTFVRHGSGPVLTASLHEPFLVGDPFVQVMSGTWHMWYIFGERWIPNAESDGSAARVYKIAHATSKDGVLWLKDARAIVDDRLGPDECQALPTVLSFGGKHHMFFCYRHATDFRRNRKRGYRLGYAFSTNLVSWERADELAGIELSETGWDCDMMCYPHLVRARENVFLLYNGNEFGRRGFGAAILRPGET
ncbi:MAG: hypothetical protein U0270_24535 [Labilithrix sp.]